MLTIAIIIFLLIMSFYIYFYWSFSYWKRKGLPYVTPSIPFGTMENPFNRTITIGLYLKKLYDLQKRLGNRHAGLYFFTRPEYLVLEPDLIKNVLQTDYQHFLDRDHYFNEVNDPLSANLFAIGGKKWKELRAKLTPTFTIGKMKMMFECVHQIGLQMEKALDNLCRLNKPIDIKSVVASYTTDVIGSCAFGLNCNSFVHPDAEFKKYGEEIFQPLGKLHSVLVALAFYKPKLGRLLNVTYFPKTATKFFMDTVVDTVKYRQANNVERQDMLHILIELKKENKITVKEIAAQAFIFYIAGFETSSTTITFALYELARHPHIQEQVRKEVHKVLEIYNWQFTYDAVNELKYTEQVVEETLRKYPPLPFLTRQCVMDYKVPESEIIIQKGTKVIIPVYGLHYDASYYPDPDTFKPERFSDTNKQHINPFTYLPFGGGARICLGLRFGLLESKLGLAMLLKNYRFTISTETLQPLTMSKFSVLLSSDQVIYLNVERV